MNRILYVYKDGWRVFLGWLWFSFILGILQFPFHLALQHTVTEAGHGRMSNAVPFILIAVMIVAAMPFLLYWVSEWTGEFVSPRISRKKMRQIEEGDLPPWRPPEPQPGAHGYSPKET